MCYLQKTTNGKVLIPITRYLFMDFDSSFYQGKPVKVVSMNGRFIYISEGTLTDSSKDSLILTEARQEVYSYKNTSPPMTSGCSDNFNWSSDRVDIKSDDIVSICLK